MSEKSLREQLVGAWTLNSYVERDIETGVENYPFGEHPLGLILYTPDCALEAIHDLNAANVALKSEMGPFARPYLPWIESIMHVKAGEEEELELRLNSNYEKVWRMLKQRLNESGVRLKSQYCSRLYQRAKQYVAVGYRRVSLATFRKILGLEDIKDNSRRVVRSTTNPLDATSSAASTETSPGSSDDQGGIE